MNKYQEAYQRLTNERLEKFYAKKGISLEDADIICDTDGKELIYYVKE